MHATVVFSLHASPRQTATTMAHRRVAARNDSPCRPFSGPQPFRAAAVPELLARHPSHGFAAFYSSLGAPGGACAGAGGVSLRGPAGTRQRTANHFAFLSRNR